MGHKSDGDEAWERLLRACGMGVQAIWREAGERGLRGVLLTEVRFKLDADDGTSVLAILKGIEGDEQLVAFVGGPDLPTVVLSIQKKLAAVGLRWREDRPFEG